MKIRLICSFTTDDWDNIVNALYKNIVCNTLIGGSDSEYSLAEYDIKYNNYSNLDFLLVKCKENNNNDLIFISYKSELQPFDLVKVGMVDKTKGVIDHLNLKPEELKFLYIRYVGNNNVVVSNDLNVVL